MSHRRRFFSAVGLAVLGVILGGAGRARAEFLVAVGSTQTLNNALVTFDSQSAGTTSGPIAITGVTGQILDIDFRPATGALYGLSDSGQLYTINTATGAATLASTLNPTPGSTPQFGGLSGSRFGIDFNPVVDRLRVVSNTGQNLRIDVSNGATLVDGNLSAPSIVAAAYTNNFAGTATTTLYDLRYTGTSFDLTTQNPPNEGTIVPVGPTGINSPISTVGFDISGASGLAYVATNTTTATAGNIAVLATIDLTTGNVSGFAPIGATNFSVRGLAAPIGAAIPEPASVAMLGVGLAAVGLFARRRRPASAN